MRGARKTAGEIFDNPILVGTITVLVVLVAVYLSYIAENGLPFVPTYSVKVEVQNAAELVKNADVRIGGARVGQVLTITPEPGDPSDRAWPHPFARLTLALQKSLQPLPADTHYQVRLASVLGGKYVELMPPSGAQKAEGLPDGGTLSLKRGLAEPFVDLDTAFNTFGPKTQTGIRRLTASLGDALAGRGTQLNDSIYAFHSLLPPLQSLLRLLAAPATQLSRFISGAASTTSALAGVAPTASALLADGAVTAQALSGPALGQTIDALPSTESVATKLFTDSQPVLRDAVSVADALRPGAALLTGAARGIDGIVITATPVFRLVPGLAARTQSALGSAGTLARDPAAQNAFKVLNTNDLATFGSSAFVGLGALLKSVASAQFNCNVTGPWLRNFASTLSEGDSTGAWLRTEFLLGPTQTFEASKPSSDLNADIYPKETPSECQGANDVYSAGQKIGDPGPTSKLVDNTAPPNGVLALGARKGLVP